MGPLAPRGPTAQAFLKLTWEYPVYASTTEQKRSDATATKAARSALTAEQSFHYLVGKDPRPVLVLRECAMCNKTDNALLTPGYDNERVLFLTRWFHCVKLPVDVVQADHPFHALFASDDAEHLFVATADGSTKIPLESGLSRVELCTAMSNVLAAAYTKDPAALYKDLQTLGDQLDALDTRIKSLKDRRVALITSNGTGSKTADKQKVAKIDAEIEGLEKEIAQKVAGFEKSTKIPLRPGDPAAKTKEAGKG